MERLRAIVFADDPLIRSGLAALLEEEGSVRAVTGDDLQRCDVAIVFAQSVGDNTATLLNEITGSASAPIVLVTEQAGESRLEDIAAARVHSILACDLLCGKTLAAVVTAAFETGDVTLRWNFGQRVERLRAQHHFTPEFTDSGNGLSASSPLAAREVAVLRLVAEGLDSKEVAARLSCSVRTVKSTVQKMTSRLHLVNRAHAVAYAVRIGAI